MDLSGYFHKNFETPLQVHILHLLIPCPHQIGTVQTFLKVLSFLHQYYLLWSLLELTSSLQFFKITLKQYQLVEVLISNINALQLPGVSIRVNKESQEVGRRLPQYLFKCLFIPVL